MCIEKLTNFVQSSFKIYRLQKKYQKLCQLYTSTHFKIDKKIGPQTQRAFIISCNLDMLCNKVTKYQVPFLQQPSHCACSKMSKTDLCGLRFVLSSVIDCRPKGYQTTSNASSSLHMSIFPRSGQNKSSLRAWEILDVNYGLQRNLSLDFLNTCPEFIIGVYFKSNATGHAW